MHNTFQDTTIARAMGWGRFMQPGVMKTVKAMQNKRSLVRTFASK